MPPVYVKYNAREGGLTVDHTSKNPAEVQLTHHQSQGVPPALKVMTMSSTDIVLNAIHQKHPSLNQPTVSTNHFDIDSFISLWACCNPELAVKHEALVREVARIGDFREFLYNGTTDREGLAGYYESSEELSRQALKCCCWLNSTERREFERPFNSVRAKIMQGIKPTNSKNTDENKFEFFLPKFGKVLAEPDLPEHEKVWREEYDRVLAGCASCEAADVHDELGLLVLKAPEPLHYYSAFANSRGLDQVLSIYSKNRYEIDQKYTQTVELTTRGTVPRLDLAPLAETLNTLEDQLGGHEADGENGRPLWAADPLRSAGPIMRMNSRELDKAEKYGHPSERPIFSSNLNPTIFQKVVTSYFNYGFEKGCVRGLKNPGDWPEKRKWSFRELKQFNESIEWEPWRQTLSQEFIQMMKGAEAGGHSSGLAPAQTNASKL